jgi:serine/threonine protein kinase
VSLVSDLRDSKFYALKQMDKQHKNLFLTESIMFATIRNQCQDEDVHLSCIHERFETDHHYVIVSDYVVGYTLMEYTKVIQKLSLTDRETFVEKLIEQLMSTLHYLASQNIAHRDIKLDNIIYNPVEDRFTLIDYGISCINSCFSYAGSLGYISPEIFRIIKLNESDPATLPMSSYFKSDVYALGVVAFEILNGHKPFKKQNNNFDFESGPQWSVDIDEIDKTIFIIVNDFLSGQLTAADVQQKYKWLSPQYLFD